MSDNKLPINRDEKHYTAFLLPNMLLNDNLFSIGRFFNFVGVPNEFLKEKYSISEIEILPEYSLNKIKKNERWAAAIKGKKLLVPDLVILIKLSPTRKFLLVIEGKVFSNITTDAFREQIDNQKEYINAIMEGESIRKEDILHIGLVMEKLEMFQLKNEEKLIFWKDVLDVFENQRGTYAYEYLKEAINEKENLISRSKNTYRKNCTDVWTIYEIIEYYLKGKEYSDFIVGSQYGIKNLMKQVYNGTISLENKEFEVNTTTNKPLNSNWYHVKELIRFINSYEGFHQSIHEYN